MKNVCSLLKQALDWDFNPDLNPQTSLCPLKLHERPAYQDSHTRIERLQENINREIRRIPSVILEPVIDNFNVRLVEVTQQHWAGIEHFVNY